MIQLHHLNNSRSQRILWLLEELGIPYEVVRYQRDPKTMLAPPSLKAIHPLGKSPIVTDGAETLAESGAIIETLVERYGNGRFIPPAGTPDRQRYRYWLHYAEGSAMPPFLMKLLAGRLSKAPVPAIIRPIGRLLGQGMSKGFIDPQITLHLNFMEAELGRSSWFAGNELTGADIQMSFPVEVAVARGGLDASRPKLWDFLKRLQARPAYQQALEKGGAYELMK